MSDGTNERELAFREFMRLWDLYEPLPLIESESKTDQASRRSKLSSAVVVMIVGLSTFVVGIVLAVLLVRWRQT